MHDPAERAADPELRAERAHLRACREALRRMGEDVLATETPLGDMTVDEYNNEVLRRARARRAERLADLPAVPLFFGRLDYPPGSVHDDSGARGRDGDVLHIGRRGVRDAAGVPVVVDRRAPIASAFYRAGPDEPMGVRRRRRYGFDRDGEITAYEDEALDAAWTTDTRGGTVLADELERPRSGPMRDIVATIQPEQDELVRAPLEHTLCVQGAPGTGKTAVGLHRLAYLLYTERDRPPGRDRDRRARPFVPRLHPRRPPGPRRGRRHPRDHGGAARLQRRGRDPAGRRAGRASQGRRPDGRAHPARPGPAHRPPATRPCRRRPAIARRAGGSCTVLGDLAQAASPAAVGDRPTLLAHLGRPGGRIVELGRGYRVPAQIIDYAARLLPRVAPGVRVPTSARRSTGALRVTEGAPGRLAASTVPACREALAGEGSVGLIAADADLRALHRAVTDAGLRSAVLGGDGVAMDAERPICVPASLAKGLEFETVVVAEPAHIVRAEPRGLHRLYVVLTRAVSALRVVHTEPLPEPLADAVPSRR